MTYLTEYIKQKKKEEEEQRKLSGLPAPLRKQTTYSPPALANRNDNTYYDDPKQTKGSLGMWEDAAWAVPSLLYHGVNSALMGAPDYISKAVYDGWTPFDIEEAGTWEKVGGIVGEAAGFLAPMMGIGKVLSAPIRYYAGSGKIIRGAKAAASTDAAGAAMARIGSKVRASDVIPGASGRYIGKEAAEKELRTAADKSIQKTMDEAVESNMKNTGLFKKIFGKDKPKKWVDSAYNPTMAESARAQKAIQEAVRAGLKKDLADIPGITPGIIDRTTKTFMTGLKEGEHLNTTGAWLGRLLGGATPGRFRSKLSGYAGRFADMTLSFGVYNTADEMLHRSFDPDYEPQGWGEIATGTLLFAAALPLIEAIPGGVKGAMSIKNYRDIAGVMKKPKYKDMTKVELATYYDYIRYKMPGRRIGNISNAKMGVRDELGAPKNVKKDDLIAGLEDWYTVARKDFRKLFVGEQAKNFSLSLPRMISGALYFGGAMDTEAMMRGQLRQGFLSEGFIDHLKKDPWSVSSHMLTGAFFTHHRKPLSRDAKGKWQHQVHYKEEYLEQLQLLKDLGYNAEHLEFMFSAQSWRDSYDGTVGGSYSQTRIGKEVASIADRYMQKAKKRAAEGEYDSTLDAVDDVNIVEAYEIWRASKAHRIMNNPEGERNNTDKIEERSLFEHLTEADRKEFRREIAEVETHKVKEDGSREKIGDTTWGTLRSEYFDPLILKNNADFFQSYLLSVASQFGGAEKPYIDEATGILKNLPRVAEGSEGDIGELMKYKDIAERLKELGKVDFAVGDEMNINAKDLNNVGPDGKSGYENLMQMTRDHEDKYGEMIFGKNNNVRIDFGELNITWNSMYGLEERRVMERLTKIVTGDKEGLTDNEMRVWSYIKEIFGDRFSSDWRMYTGEDATSGDEILRRGEKKTPKQWKERKDEDKDHHDDIMQVLEMAHQLLRYTPLGNKARIQASDAGRPKAISVRQGEGLATALRQTGLLGGVVKAGSLTPKFKRYLFERAIDRVELQHSDFALIQHGIDSKIFLEPRVDTGGNIMLTIPDPSTIRHGLVKEGVLSKKEIDVLVKDYTKLVYNRLSQFSGFVKTGDKGDYFADTNIVQELENPEIKSILNTSSFRKYILEARELSEVSMKQAKSELEGVINVIKEADLASPIKGLEQIIRRNELDNTAALIGVRDSLRDHIRSRENAGALNPTEKSILNSLKEKVEKLVEVLEARDVLEAEGNSDDARKLEVAEVLDSKEKLMSSVEALENILDSSGNFKSKSKTVKLVGDLISNYGTENVLKSTIAFKRLKQALLKNMNLDSDSRIPLNQLIKRFEKEGRFKDFQQIVTDTFTGALSTLDKEQIEEINRVMIKEQQEMYAALNKARYSISPDTIARRYEGVFYDNKTKSFSEDFKQRIISAFEKDILDGGTENIRELVNEMIESVVTYKDKNDKKIYSKEDFVAEELPKLLHTIVSTEKKDLFSYNARTKELKKGETHGAKGKIEEYIDWWQETVSEFHSLSDTPSIYITRLSRSSIDENGYLKDIALGGEFDFESMILGLQNISPEVSAEVLNKLERKASEGGMSIEELIKSEELAGRPFKFVVVVVDAGGSEMMVDMNGIMAQKDSFNKTVKKWYDAESSRLESEVNAKAKDNFNDLFGDVLKSFQDGNITPDKVQLIMRHMYYSSTNTSSFDKMMVATSKDEMGAAQSNLFKYSMTAQGENAGRLSTKVAEILRDVASDHEIVADGKNQDYRAFLQALKKFEKKGWNFDLSVIRDEGIGDVESLFSSTAITKMIYNEMAVKTFDELTRKFHLEGTDVAERYDIDWSKSAVEIAQDFLKNIEKKKDVSPYLREHDISDGDVLQYLPSTGKRPILGVAKQYKVIGRDEKGFTLQVEGREQHIKYEELKDFVQTGPKAKLVQDKVKDVKAATKDALAKELENIITWRDQSLEELTKVSNDVSAIDGVTYLSTDAAKFIFGMNGFFIGDGFAGVKPIISHNKNPFFHEGVTQSQTLIGKTHFVYDPRIAQHLDKKGVDILMGKSAAKSFSGTINDLAAIDADGTLLPAGIKAREGLNSNNIFEKTMGLINTDNNFRLPVSSIGVVYNAQKLHPAKIVPALAIGMSANDTKDFATSSRKSYANLENHLYKIREDALGLNDWRRTSIVQAMVEEARITGFDLDVGGGGVAMQLFKLGMDASDPFIKREVIRLFHKAKTARLAGVETDGAGVSVMIPEFSTRLPVYSTVGPKGNRRQTRYGGKKVPYDMGIKTGLFTGKDDVNWLYKGEKGQDISYRNEEHIDPTLERYIIKDKNDHTLNAESLISDIDKMIKGAGLSWNELSVADLHQLINIRFGEGNNMFSRYYEPGITDDGVHLIVTGSQYKDNVSTILRSAFGKDYSKQQALREFTYRLAESDLGLAVPGVRIPSQSFGDVVISRLEGIYSRAFGNVIGANPMDVITKHQGDYDVDKMFYYVDAPKSLMNKAILNSGFNIEPQNIPVENTEWDVDLLNNNYVHGKPVGTSGGRDGALVHKGNLVKNKFLIGRINRLNYSLGLLLETGFEMKGLELLKGFHEVNTFEGRTPENEKKMADTSQRISNLASILFDPHKKTHRAAFASDNVLLRYILFGDWSTDLNMPSPSKGTGIGEDPNGIFGKVGRPFIRRNNRNIELDNSHTEVMKDAYILALNTMGRSARIFSGVFDETGQRAPEYWEYADIKDGVDRFRKSPTAFLFTRLAWQYRRDNVKLSSLFDLFVRHNTSQYSDISRAMTAWRNGTFEWAALSNDFVQHKYQDSKSVDNFYKLTPALRVLDGITSKDDNKVVYTSAIDQTVRRTNSMYSTEARNLINDFVMISAFSGQEPDSAQMRKMWDNAQLRIQAGLKGSLAEMKQQQYRDILWQVLERELKSQDKFLNHLRGDRYANANDVELSVSRVDKIRKVLRFIENRSLHGEVYRDNLILDEDKVDGKGNWANVNITSIGRQGRWIENDRRQDIVVYTVDTSNLPEGTANLENATFNMLKGGMRIKPGDRVWGQSNTKYVTLKNPIREVSTSADEFIHGLSAFAASTTLTPESLRHPLPKEQEAQFYDDINHIRAALKDEGKTLKQNLRQRPAERSMAFATNNWKVNDLLRLLMRRYVTPLRGARQRENRLIDIWELLTMVEPLHGAASEIKGLPDVSIPVFIQNRDIMRYVSKFYLRDLADEGGPRIVSDYLKRKSNFYKMFIRESGDRTDIENGLRDRLASADARILPEHLSELKRHEKIVHDIINTPLRRFSDLALRWAFYSEYDVSDAMMKNRPNMNRKIVRPWGSRDELYLLENYSTSGSTDPLKTYSTGKTIFDIAGDNIICN